LFGRYGHGVGNIDPVKATIARNAQEFVCGDFKILGNRYDLIRP
jgi:hypothetical protein